MSRTYDRNVVEMVREAGDWVVDATLDLVDLAGVAVEVVTDKIKPDYTCQAGKCRELGGVVVAKSDTHMHACPIEGDMCGSSACHKSGSCQA